MQKCLYVKKKKPIPYQISIMLTFFTLLMFGNCNSAKRVAHKRNNFLLNCRVDTLKINASELSIRDSSIIPCLDAIISATTKLPEYDERIEPLFWINFRRLKDSILVDFESNNFYESLDIGLLLGEKNANLLPETEYEVLIYEKIKFITMIYNDDSTGKLNKIKASFLERNQKRMYFNSYRFYSADDKIIENILLWSNEIRFSYINHHLSNSRRIYHPINRPFMVVH